MGKNLSGLDWVALLLVLIGGINWGLVGGLGYNLVEQFGMGLAKIIYILVGLSAVYLLFTMKGLARK